MKASSLDCKPLSRSSKVMKMTKAIKLMLIQLFDKMMGSSVGENSKNMAIMVGKGPDFSEELQIKEIGSMLHQMQRGSRTLAEEKNILREINKFVVLLMKQRNQRPSINGMSALHCWFGKKLSRMEST
ncbi:hypothetical protein FRX31_012774 [Thalictrum thalictroides]|uniref:Uncharacterized protein n=1 Tax=Thalictrum thalictroides TaxID=46969 RepID=A0A7J6WM16_THATH|nr:hypothetical protein FRX31_012774 [Thalictrum thalictroides]